MRIVGSGLRRENVWRAKEAEDSWSRGLRSIERKLRTIVIVALDTH